MTIFHQSDSLFTGINVPLSGTGSSTPEPVAGNADYSSWPWEVMLATVLGIGAPDRGEVTGQPWLTVLSNGQNAGGAHLIWTANWDTSPNSGATSIQVYLNPALYTVGGAWDRFLNAPPQALSGVTGGNYAGLPLKPPDFQLLSLSVASARNWMAAAANHLAALHRVADSGPIAKFQGNLAQVVTELLGDLRGFMASLHEQMSHPAPYDALIAAAGEAASRFLTDLMSAYSGWTQLPEHSPLGAVVQVLEDIATPDSSGVYVIPDPQNSPYGDLTNSGTWAAVEQRAKTLWASTLIGGPPGFAGLDPLGRAALSNLVEQFGTTTSEVVPVLGPAPPTPSQRPVRPGGPNGSGGPGGNGGSGGNGGPAGHPPGAGGPGGPVGSGSPTFVTSHNGGPNGPAGPGGGPAGPAGGSGPGLDGANLAVQPGGTGGPAGQVLAGQVLAGPGPGGSVPGGSVPGGQVLAGSVSGGPVPGGQVPGGPAGESVFAPVASGAVLAGGLGGIGGPQPGTNANPADPAPTSDPSQPGNLAAGVGGFSGTIGRPQNDSTEAGDEVPGRQGKRDRKGVPLSGPQAPPPGFSLGRDAVGPVLKRFAVPALATRPPAITSSPVNSQLAPASGGVGDPSGLSVTTPSADPQAVVSSVPVPESAPIGMGQPAMLAPGALGVGGTDAGGLNPGGMAIDEGGPMILPPGGMGGGQPGKERQRLAYLPEEPEYWGTAPAIGGRSLGPGEPAEFDESAEPEFVPVLAPALGSGARTKHGSAGEST